MATNKQFHVSVVIGAKDKASKKVGGIVGRVGRQAQAASKHIGRMGIGLAKVGMAAGAVGVAGVFAVGRLIDRYAEAKDELSKFSHQVGISGQTLQEWQFAAERAGVPTETMSKGVEKLARNIGDLKAGTGTLVTLLRKSNPELLKQLETVDDTGEAMDILVRSLSEEEDLTKRASLSAAAFGRAGQRMALLLGLGADGIEDLRKQAREYGVASDEALADAEEYEDAMTNVRAAVGGLVNIIGGRLIPILNPLIQRTAKWISTNKQLVGLKMERVVGGLLSGLEGVGRWLDKNGAEAWAGIESGVRGVGSVVGTLAKHWGEVKTAAVGFMALWAAGKVVGVIASIGQLTAATGLLAAKWAAVGASAVLAYEVLKGIGVIEDESERPSDLRREGPSPETVAELDARREAWLAAREDERTGMDRTKSDFFGQSGQTTSAQDFEFAAGMATNPDVFVTLNVSGQNIRAESPQVSGGRATVRERRNVGRRMATEGAY